MKRIIFICRNNSALSQIAEGFAKHLGVGTMQVTSAGLEASEVDPEAITSMNEIGVDISRQTSKALSQFNPENFDIVISLGDNDRSLPSQWRLRERSEEWQLDDPTGKPETLPNVRDEIRKRVIDLIESLQQSR
ncbi:arsenate reductase ArsC [Pantanalinema sp. GBBB05]|uniref:arsenate reductase ArsC n=1 Tax=Pantanalinema sp. GBBB05 TaxID=2604139 RepID=UPI001DE25D8A|nr:ArsC family transcriptional regulator [Pantanalinema sp. GBBB05]